MHRPSLWPPRWRGAVGLGEAYPRPAAVALPTFVTGFFSLPDNHTAQRREPPSYGESSAHSGALILSCTLARLDTLIAAVGLLSPNADAVLVMCCCTYWPTWHLAPMNNYFYLLGYFLAYLYFAQ